MMFTPSFSPTSWQILTFLSQRPAETIHLRALARAIGKSPRPTQLAVRELEVVGLLTARHQANRKLLRLNQRHALYPGLKLLLGAMIHSPGYLRRPRKRASTIAPATVKRLPATPRPMMMKPISDIDQ